MAKMRSKGSVNNGGMFGSGITLGNLAIFLIVLLLILHITGYVEVRAKTTEGFYYKKLSIASIVF